MTEVDWVELWRQLSTRFRKSVSHKHDRQTDAWEQMARDFDASVKRRWQQPDQLLEFVLKHLRPQETVVDIGAGTGGWSIPMARVAREVTAVEPSPSMMAMLRENAAAAGLSNLHLVQARWEEAEVEPQDVALCSHGMYASPDLVGFVRKMERCARRSCFLVMRVPSHHGVMGELSQLIYGQWHDSPNFVVAYNALSSVGIYANVLMEPTVRPWTSQSLEEALRQAKRHLGLRNSAAHDDLIRQTLARRLTFIDGRYLWPDGKRSALVWWETSPNRPPKGP